MTNPSEAALVISSLLVYVFLSYRPGSPENTDTVCSILGEHLSE
jgi:hypothetical protein